MKVFKFGGASVKDVVSVKNVCKIIQQFREEDLVVVISAMGKTTNKLETIIDAFLNNKENKTTLISDLLNEHKKVIENLFESNHSVLLKVMALFEECKNNLNEYKTSTYNFIYDQVICTGELASTLIVNAYLNEIGVSASWLDAKSVIKTNNTYREAVVNWEKTTERIQTLFKDKKGVTITQGFIGSDDNNFTTTLGREGSDYSAAIFAYALHASSVHIWKDVEGILSADPKIYTEATFIPAITYNDAIEMTYYGAKVIHPKTIKPLQNKNIPLVVRPFGNVAASGTVISKNPAKDTSPPVVILKEEQVLLKITSKDFSFIAEKNLSHILDIFSTHLVKINLFQTAAIKVYACVNHNRQKIPNLIKDLEKQYEVMVMENLKVLTIRNYTEDAIQKYAGDSPKIMEQKSKKTVQYVLIDAYL